MDVRRRRFELKSLKKSYKGSVTADRIDLLLNSQGLSQIRVDSTKAVVTSEARTTISQPDQQNVFENLVYLVRPECKKDNTISAHHSSGSVISYG